MTKIAEVIKYEGDNATFIWKHPSEDFNSFTQLIVHQSQEAIFFMNGEALDLFGPGRYTLETQNIPIASKFFNRPTGGETPFHCEVYFINKTDQMAIKWGTDSKVQFMEPTYNFPIYIGASGEMSLRAADARKLLVKLVGTETQLSQAKLVSYFRAFLMTRVKAYLAQTIKSQRINVFEIDEYLNELSTILQERIAPDLADYGIALERFLVTTIVKPDGDTAYEKFKSLHFRKYADVEEARLRQQIGVIDQQAEAQRLIIQAQGIAQKRQAEGYSYQEERGFDVAEKVATNEGAGNFTSAGLGLGVVAGVGRAVGGAVGGVFQDAMTPIREGTESKTDTRPAQPTQFCDDCGSQLLAGSAFCDECGHSAVKTRDACGNCGFVFEKPGKFCPKCGSKRGANQ